jgi:hypothetical protein
MAINNKSLLDAAAALFVNDVIDEWESAAVYGQTSNKSPEFQYWEYEKVETQLQNMTNDECKADFRVSLEDLPLLASLRNADRVSSALRRLPLGRSVTYSGSFCLP